MKFMPLACRAKAHLKGVFFTDTGRNPEKLSPPPTSGFPQLEGSKEKQGTTENSPAAGTGRWSLPSNSSSHCPSPNPNSRPSGVWCK